jgi:transcriptional regulator with XRE-family HTH domain
MNVTIADRLANMRREKGFSQEELAEKLGLSRQAISKWERAESSPDTDNLIALAKLYGTSLDNLLALEPGIEDDVEFEATDKALDGSGDFAAGGGSASNVDAQSAAKTVEAAAKTAEAAAAAAQAATEAARQANQNQSRGPHGQHPRGPYIYTDDPAYAVDPKAAAKAFKKSHYTAPDGQVRRKRTLLWDVPYPVIVVIVYLVIGFFFDLWHPGWLLFLTVPLWYWICHIVDNDRYRREEENDATKQG